MPPDCLHMTTLEITHSLTELEIETLVDNLKPSIPTVSMRLSHCHTSSVVFEKHEKKSQHQGA